MKGKIKKIFEFLRCALSGGWRGVIGLIILIFAFGMFIRIFYGERNIQRYVINIWAVNKEQIALNAAHADLNNLKRHIDLLKNISPDYVQELGLKHLNMGDPKFKILKI